MKKILLLCMCFFLIGCQSELEDLNKEALVYIKNLNYTEALNVLNEAIELDGENDITWNNISVCYEAIGEYQLALEAAQNAVNIGEEKAAEYANLGNANYDLGHHKAAKLAYDKALQIDDDYFYAKYGIGIYFSDQGDYETALSYFEDLYDNNPINIDVVKNIAFCNYQLGKVDASIAFLEGEIEKIDSSELHELLNMIQDMKTKE